MINPSKNPIIEWIPIILIKPSDKGNIFDIDSSKEQKTELKITEIHEAINAVKYILFLKYFIQTIIDIGR